MKTEPFFVILKRRSVMVILPLVNTAGRNAVHCHLNNIFLRHFHTAKRRIMTEALRLFARDGYEAVSVESIAAAVGIRAPSLYKHYRSKRDIYDSILREMERRDAENAEP